jgi:hypothetical protein
VPAPIFPTIPVIPWKLYPNVSDIPRKGYKGIEVEAIAIEQDPGGVMYYARVICSPEDGPLQMCSVYLREDGGGAVCIADLTTKEEAFEYAAAISKARGWDVDGSIYELRIREVPGKGYLADPRQAVPFTLDPAKAALYHSVIAKDDLFVGGPGEHGRWIEWADATNHAVDRAAEKSALLDRVYQATIGAMGASAPTDGSRDGERMRDMLKAVIEANRSDRLVVFNADQRRLVIETIEEDRIIDLAGHECDEDLCDLLLGVSPTDLFKNVEPEREIDILKAFASEAGVGAISSAVERTPMYLEQPMLRSIHRHLERHDIESPFGHYFAEAESESAPAPRG